ncbi:MAG: DUF1254 domain-containing protein [Sphingomonadales bacterium]|nr:DUF1254 domain-containing protein [Sphingomonadales bacterium]
MNRVLAALLAGLVGAATPASPLAAQDKPVAASAIVERRAIETALWAIPIVSFDAMREAYFRDAGAHYNDIIHWPRGADWHMQLTTPNTTSHYAYLNFNLKDGPLVLEIPGADGAGTYGNLADAWQVPVEEFGPSGIDEGQGGKFVLLPPGYQGSAPAGYRVVQMPTFNGQVLFRANPASRSARDLAAGDALIRRLRAYPLTQAAAPPPQRLIDMTDRLIDGIVRYDDTFFDRLARMINEEPPQARDKVAMGMAQSLGLGRGTPFTPDSTRRALLARAAAEAKAEAIDLTQTNRTPWWPDGRWTTPRGFLAFGQAGMTFETADSLLVDPRAQTFYLAFAVPKRLGGASFYLSQLSDAQGHPLSGDKHWQLHVPAKVPTRQFWAVTVYDLDTGGFIRDAAVVGYDSLDRNLRRNADGSVDFHFSAERPADRKTNWIALKPGGRWFVSFRFYGPDPTLRDKTWRLPDLVEVP